MGEEAKQVSFAFSFISIFLAYFYARTHYILLYFSCFWQELAAEENSAEEKQEKESKPPSPCVLFVDLHCIGCAKKIKKSIMKMRGSILSSVTFVLIPYVHAYTRSFSFICIFLLTGVEGVVIDMAKNQVTIRGRVEPEAICNMITKKTKKRAQVIPPLPEPEGESIPEVVTSQVSRDFPFPVFQRKEKYTKLN